MCDPLREGISKAHFPLFKPHLKGSARLQGFTLRGQYFFSRALQGFSKASLSLFKPSSHGPCKVCMTESNLSLLCLCVWKASARLQSLCSNLFLKGSARLQQGTLPFVQKFLSRAMQGKASTSAPLHHSLNQTRYRKPTDMHSPPRNITT